MFAKGSTAQARLRARFRQSGANVIIAPDSDKTVTLGYAATPTPGWKPQFEFKVVGIVVVAVVGAVAYLVLRGRRPAEAEVY